MAVRRRRTRREKIVAANPHANWVALGVTWGFVLFAFLYFFFVNPFGKAPVNLLLGAVVIVVALIPLSSWLLDPPANPIPVLAMHGIFYAICFGFAGFVIPSRYMGGIEVAEQEYFPALALTLLGLLCCYAGYRFVRLFNVPRFASTWNTDDVELDKLAVYLFYPAALLLSEVVPLMGITALSKTVFILHRVAFIWVLYAAWGGRLTRDQQHFVLWVYLPLDLVLNLGLESGRLAGLLTFAQLLGVTYVATRRKVPVVLIGLCAALFLLLQPVKSEYRLMTWHQNNEDETKLDRLGAFVSLGLDQYFGDGQLDYGEALNDAYRRVNHLHLTASVVAETPRVVPFKEGATYLPLITKLIPRFLWPGKPREDLGNAWALDYGYLLSGDDVTSLNLPWITEMYMNFGITGVAVINALVGALMGLIWSFFVAGVRAPLQFGVALTLSSAFFFPESNLSLQLGDLMIGVVVIYAFLFAVVPRRKRAPVAAVKIRARAGR